MKRFGSSAAIALAALIIGIGIGRYKFPLLKNSIAQKSLHSSRTLALSSTPAPPPSISSLEGESDFEGIPSGLSVQAIISKIKTALMHSGRQRSYAALNRVLESIDQQNVREVLAFVE